MNYISIKLLFKNWGNKRKRRKHIALKQLHECSKVDYVEYVKSKRMNVEDTISYRGFTKLK